MNMKYSHYSCPLFPDMFSFVNVIPTIRLLGFLSVPHIPYLQWPSKTLFQLFHSRDCNSPENQLYMVNLAIALCTVPLFLPSCSLVPTVTSLPHQDLSVMTIPTTSFLSSCPSSPCLDFLAHTLHFLLSISHNFLVHQPMHHKLVTKVLNRPNQKPFLRLYPHCWLLLGKSYLWEHWLNLKFLFSNGYSVLLPILSHSPHDLILSFSNISHCRCSSNIQFSTFPFL